MPRWLEVALTLVLFTAVMLAVGWGLKQVVPPFNRWLDNTVGEMPSLLLILGVGAACAIAGLWPRDAAGRMKRLPTRR